MRLRIDIYHHGLGSTCEEHEQLNRIEKKLDDLTALVTAGFAEVNTKLDELLGGGTGTVVKFQISNVREQP